jgi:hypothetical protein
MFKAMAIFFKGDRVAAQRIIKRINPDKFYFISKIYFTDILKDFKSIM